MIWSQSLHSKMFVFDKFSYCTSHKHTFGSFPLLIAHYIDSRFRSYKQYGYFWPAYKTHDFQTKRNTTSTQKNLEPRGLQTSVREVLASHTSVWSAPLALLIVRKWVDQTFFRLIPDELKSFHGPHVYIRTSRDRLVISSQHRENKATVLVVVS